MTDFRSKLPSKWLTVGQLKSLISDADENGFVLIEVPEGFRNDSPLTYFSHAELIAPKATPNLIVLRMSEHHERREA